MQDDKKHLVDVAMSLYTGEPCRICGKLIEPQDLKELVYAGDSVDNESRAAHGDCWTLNKPKEEWAYPIDSAVEPDMACHLRNHHRQGRPQVVRAIEKLKGTR